jgi:hypothetical protein
VMGIQRKAAEREHLLILRTTAITDGVANVVFGMLRVMRSFVILGRWAIVF